MGMGASLTMGMGAPLWLAIWVLMMVAVMFPGAAPMILAFARVHSARRSQGRPFVPAWVFTAGYLLVWTLAGVVAYGAAAAAESLAARSPWVMANAGRVGGATLIAAAIYQISPLKQVCLTRCRSPLAFVMGSWREGPAGALRMGIEHGAWCLGCCWLLFVILFPLGMLNMAALASVTALIFAEKTLPWGRAIAWAGAGAMCAYGLVLIAAPSAGP
jgi:predicted metal-binding membrane protein